jgi:hypothetical protein
MFIACAILAACGTGSHSSDVSQFLGVWQTTGGNGSYQCSDGSHGNKPVMAGDKYTIGADDTWDLKATTSAGCTAVLDVSGNRATGSSLVCQGKADLTVTLTVVLSTNVLTWTQAGSSTDNGNTCSETDTLLFARTIAGN